MALATVLLVALLLVPASAAAHGGQPASAAQMVEPVVMPVEIDRAWTATAEQLATRRRWTRTFDGQAPISRAAR